MELDLDRERETDRDIQAEARKQAEAGRQTQVEKCGATGLGQKDGQKQTSTGKADRTAERQHVP